jgi:hypothetical protein
MFSRLPTPPMMKAKRKKRIRFVVGCGNFIKSVRYVLAGECFAIHAKKHSKKLNQ